jgi:hypothetical protein
MSFFQDRLKIEVNVSPNVTMQSTVSLLNIGVNSIHYQGQAENIAMFPLRAPLNFLLPRGYKAQLIFTLKVGRNIQSKSKFIE